MAKIADQNLTGRVVLDDMIFSNCEFRNADLVYSGGVPPNFINCRFADSRFTFDAAAGNTLTFFRAMLPAKTGMRDIALGLVPELNG